jgi:nucleoside-diphosphate-sugar epimerase
MTDTGSVLITGANGEVGHGLIDHLSRDPHLAIVATDIQPLDSSLQGTPLEFIAGDILDPAILEKLFAGRNYRTIFHLASLLSTKGERSPEAAFRVNVDGTFQLLSRTMRQAQEQKRTVKFLYPSSIAAYGLPDVATKISAGRVSEDDWCFPATMYGCNKLACENLGAYFSKYYRRLDEHPSPFGIDFRSVRFPGLISALTVPTGGTSDYGPEMLHYAAQGKPYDCFVRRDACLPFMVMPDAIRALLDLEAAPREQLRRVVYNVTSFSLSAEEIYRLTLDAFPSASVRFVPDERRQGIVDSWPCDVEDAAARRDWGWRPGYDCQRAFDQYLIPAIRERYRAPNAPA